MVDWNGLFKWTMKYQDPEDKKDIKAMDKDTQKWLSDAMEEYTFSEFNRMKEIVGQLQKDEKDTKEDQENRFQLLEELQELVEGLENARDLNVLAGFELLMLIMFTSKYENCRIVAMEIFSSCNQNNAQVQFKCISLGGFKLINIIMDSKKSIKEREYAFSCLGSLIRGEHLEGKRQFIDTDGIEFVVKMLQETESKKIKFKAMSIIRDLVLYNERLHMTVNNIENYANTNAEKDKTAFYAGKDSEETQKEKQINNELEQNKKFFKIVTQKLQSLNFIDTFILSIVGDFENRGTDYRAAFAEIALALMKEYPEEQLLQIKNLQVLKSNFEQLLEVNKENEGMNILEVNNWTALLHLYVKKN